MSATLEHREIPGFREALTREATVRRQAWIHRDSRIAGVRVRAITLRDTIILEEMQNGFFAPWRFDSDQEFLGHCAQLVWWLSDAPKPARESQSALQPLVAAGRQRLMRHLSAMPEQLAKETTEFLRATFMDAPKASGQQNGAAVASTPAYLADTLAAAGLFEGMDKMLDMPLTQLWQLVRLATRRVYGVPLTNESDRLACDFLATVNAGKN